MSENGRRYMDIGYIMKVNIDNLNSSENPGNLVLLKKVQNTRGEYFAYVSGQAFRYYLKQTLRQMGVNLTKLESNGEIKIDENAPKKEKERYKYIVRNHVDLDLFGFMEAKKTEKGEKGKIALRRWSPVKVTPLISIYPWKGESDLLTQKKEGRGELVKVEINTFNYMRGTMVINVDEVGSYIDDLNWEMEDVIGEDERRERISKLLDALKNINGGAKIARLLDDLTPKFIILAKQTAATPVFLNALDVDEDGNINIDLIKEALQNYKDIVEDYVIGIRSGIFGNEDDVKSEFEDRVKSIKDAIEMAKGWL